MPRRVITLKDKCDASLAKLRLALSREASCLSAKALFGGYRLRWRLLQVCGSSAGVLGSAGARLPSGGWTGELWRGWSGPTRLKRWGTWWRPAAGAAAAMGNNWIALASNTYEQQKRDVSHQALSGHLYAWYLVTWWRIGAKSPTSFIAV